MSPPLLREELPRPTAIAPGRTDARLSCLGLDMVVEGSPPCARGTLDVFLRRVSKPSGTLLSSFVLCWLVE